MRKRRRRRNHPENYLKTSSKTEVFDDADLYMFSAIALDKMFRVVLELDQESTLRYETKILEMRSEFLYHVKIIW